MAAGEVVSIRVNPKDCMAVADLLDKLNAYSPGMSFSNAVAIALASSMESFRANGVLPERQGFEYTEMMRHFAFKKRTSRKIQLTTTFHATAAQYGIRPLVPQTPENRIAQERRKVRYDELKFKMENDALNWTPELTEEYVPLAKEFGEQP
jgi:hypothetical protein